MPKNLYDITIQQGATFQTSIKWSDSAGAAINLTGYSARMQARASYESTSTIFSLTDSSGITLGGTAGTIAVLISGSTTAGFSAPWEGVYDLELVSGGGVVTRLLEGGVLVSPEVTR
jgi:hypothetical protein